MQDSLGLIDYYPNVMCPQVVKILLHLIVDFFNTSLVLLFYALGKWLKVVVLRLSPNLTMMDSKMFLFLQWLIIENIQPVVFHVFKKEWEELAN
jgi:hypothetical protein